MQKYIEESAYKHMIDPYLQMMENLDPTAMAAEPIVIAKVIDKAINAETPNTRYVKGPMANTAIWYRNTFGDRAFDDFITQAFNPVLRQSITIGTNGLAYLNDGYDVNLSYNRGLLRFGLSYTDMDFSTEDDFEDYRKGIGLYVGSFLKYSHDGINVGLGFDYYTENQVNSLFDNEQINESLEKDLYRVYFRTAWLKDLIKFSNSSIYVEPGINVAYGFGDEDLNFNSGRIYEKVGFEFSPFVNIGAKINF